MKEKINEYLDNRVKKEEVEDILKDKEYASYYEDLKKMKEGLWELRVETPDFVSKLGLIERKRTFFRYSFAFAAVLIIVFGVVFSRNLILTKQLAHNQTTVTREFKGSQFLVPAQMPQIKVKIGGESKDALIEKLEHIANLKEVDEINSVYVFEVEGSKVNDFINTIKTFSGADILEDTLSNANIDSNASYEVKVILETK